VDLQELLQILALLNGKAGGQITGADLSRVEDPILGLLTGTYTPQQDTGPNLNDLSYQYRPTWESLLNEEYYDENSLEMKIGRSVSDGVPLMEIKKQIPQLLAASGQPAGPNDTTTQDLISFATKLDNENRDYNVAVTKANTDKNQNSWWAKAGISDPSLQADPAQILNPQLERLAQMYKPSTDPNKTPGYMSGGRYIEGGTQPDAAKETIDKRRIQTDARQAAEQQMRGKLDAPYAYGGRPGLADMGQMGVDEAMYALNKKNFGIPPQANPFNLVQAGIGLLGGTVKGMFQGMKGVNMKDAEGRKQAYVEDMVRNSTDTEDSRERDRMIARRDAMGGRSPKGKVPIRTDKVNKEKEDKMLRVAAILKERADRQAASMPTPAQNDIMNRILSMAMAERLQR
jgi:hypothetical protein